MSLKSELKDFLKENPNASREEIYDTFYEHDKSSIRGRLSEIINTKKPKERRVEAQELPKNCTCYMLDSYGNRRRRSFRIGCPIHTK